MIKQVKRSNCPKWIFTSQKNYKSSMYLLAPFILQDLKNILRADPELCAIFRPKMTHLSRAIFFWYKPFYYLHLKIDPFHCAKFKNILTADPELWGCAIFGSKVQNLKKNSPSRSRVIKMCIFWTQNDPFPKMLIFSGNLLMSLVSFIHIYLRQKSKSDINLLVKYWRLTNAEISLAKSHFWL